MRNVAARKNRFSYCTFNDIEADATNLCDITHAEMSSMASDSSHLVDIGMVRSREKANLRC